MLYCIAAVQMSPDYVVIAAQDNDIEFYFKCFPWQDWISLGRIKKTKTKKQQQQQQQKTEQNKTKPRKPGIKQA